MKLLVLLAAVGCLAFAACGGDGDDTAESTTTSTSTTTTTRAPTTTTTVPVLRYPSGDPVLPGYPRLVPLSAIDSRVQSWFSNSGTPPEQVVQVAPGVFVPYNPAVPDLADYLDLPNDGDCAVRQMYFPTTGGACWNGVPEA